MEQLLAAIRQACSASTWSRGVELARADAVVVEDASGKDVELRVSTKGGLVAPLVTLFLDDNDWSCECNWAEDACSHVAAAAIALQQSKKDGKPLPGAAAAPPPGHIAYRFEDRGGLLALLRVLVHPGGILIVDGSLAAVAKGKIKAPKFIATDIDLRFEKRVGPFISGALQRHQIRTVFAALAGSDKLTLSAKAVQIGAPTCGMHIRVSPCPEGFYATLEKDPDVTTIYRNGALLRGDTLHCIGDHGLPETQYDSLRRGRIFAAEEASTLLGDMIPRWRRTLPVLVETQDVPEVQVMRPRVQVTSEREGQNLSVLATIVYGDPPVARVDGDRLTVLRDSKTAPLRNKRLEALLRQRLADELRLEAGVRRSYELTEAIEFARTLRGDDDIVVVGTQHEHWLDRGTLAPSLSIDEQGDFALDFVGTSANSTNSAPKHDALRATPEAVLRAWERGDQYAPLLDGGFGQIPSHWLAQHGHRVSALLRAREAKQSDAAPWVMADLAGLAESLEQPPPPQWSRWKSLFEGFAGLPQPVLPADLRAELRDYQRQGVAWLSFLRDAGLGGLLADDMGLGKTLQALCAASGRTLVVAPTSVLPNWQQEIARFRPSLRVSTYHGGARELNEDADIVLTTYSILRLDQDQLTDSLWDTIILDEAQAIKNPDSQVARAAFRLQGRFRLALTGTPVENRLDDLWSQVHFANPGLLGGRSEFLERYAKPIATGSLETAAALRDRVRPFLLRRLKRDVAKELPPRTDVVLRCELRDDERQVYDAIRAATQQAVADRLGAGDNVLAVLEALLRLRQAACHTALIPGQTATQRTSSKLELLVETLEASISNGHKALVFSQWTALLDLIEPELQRANLRYLRLDGSTKDRGGVVAQFQAGDGPDVLLVSLRAGGTGLNLTAADHVFLVDPWWNPAVEDQAADRAHRIGQEQPVLVHRLVARGTVEEGILALQERKRELAHAAVAAGAGGSQITREELVALLVD